MRNTLLISAGVLTMSAGVALAAPPAPVPMPVFTWTGCYVGAFTGGTSGQSSWSNVPSPVGSASYGTSGLIGGGTLGCNYQMQQFVIGAEGELWGSTLSGSTSKLLGGEGFTLGTKSNFGGDVAARFGFAMDRALFFGKVGAAFADYQFTLDYVPVHFPSQHFTGAGTYTGLLLGVGLEYAIDMHWSVKGEYDYIDYGSKNIFMTQQGTTNHFTPSISNSENQFKVGVNFRW
jgi:outer membrane immunogenic protein